MLVGNLPACMLHGLDKLALGADDADVDRVAGVSVRRDGIDGQMFGLVENPYQAT